MSQKSPFSIQKAIQRISGEPKSVKKLRSGDLLIEASSALQTKYFLLTKTFLDCPLTVNLHRSLNSCRGVISETDLFCASEAEILEGLSDQGVTQVRRIKIKKDSSLSPTMHLILTFNSPKLPSTIKAVILTVKYALAFRILCAALSARETETRSLTTPDKFNALSTETLPESVPTTSNSEHSNALEIPQCVKRDSRNRRKRSKVQKTEIEIKMAPLRPRKSAPTEYATDEEDMITYEVEEEELEQYPTDKFALKKVLQIFLNDIYAR
ncbi:uncharacterized protein TNCV_4008791 [Trichonephila clavipes]|nr:uncharacterized protein TNCV_4008791 [Trichonephila clavipes]